IQGIASLSFVFFGLWTIRGDKLEGEENRVTKYGAIFTVAIAFFLAEMGDKTQLATVALSTKFSANPVWILMGTTTGMLIADGIGIIVGVVMCKRIPERTIKLVSAGVFILFGFIGSYQVLTGKLDLSILITALILAALAVITGVIGYFLIKNNAKSSENPEVGEYCRIKTSEALPESK
ncbi:MAG TPA: TMEM165/GDT1 family protein, partial [Clostridia bacterium]|nr:TMEM165/GDT1 family protein [Clostridia bacterium]